MSWDTKARVWGFSVAAVGVLLGFGAWLFTGHPWFGVYVAVMFGAGGGMTAAGIVRGAECDHLLSEIAADLRRNRERRFEGH